MKITKKILVILFIMMVMLGIGISKVEAKNLPHSISELKIGTTYRIKHADYEKWNKLFCVKKGHKLSSTGANYELIKKVHINNDVSKVKGQDFTVEGQPANRKLALAIATLDRSGAKNQTDLQKFLWGYFEKWVQQVGVEHGIPKAFATYTPVSNYKEISAELKEDIEDIEDSTERLQDNTDYQSINYLTVRLSDNNLYTRVGPFRIK